MLLATLSIWVSAPLFGQGLVNLGFESAVIPPGTQVGSLIPFSSAFPGWNGGGMVSYNGLSLGGPGLSIMDRNGDVTPLQGRYSAYLFAGYIPGEGDFDMSISQTGLVPAGAYALRLDAHSAYGFSVSLGGRTLSMAPLANFPNYTRYEAAIPDFTGQTAELRITSLYPYGSIPPNGLLLDNIVFMTIPESASIPIVGLSFLLFRLWPRRSHSKRAAAKWA